jgi:DDE superfamily endonuclease
VVGEGDDLPVLAGPGQVGVRVEQCVGGCVLGEEGQHASGALGAAGHVVLFEHRVIAQVHDGVEVQVECFSLSESGGQGGPVQGGQERSLLAVLEPVGVGGQRGGLRQGGQPREQGGAGVGGDVVDVGDPPGGGELERQQRQHIGQGGDLRGGQVAGRGHHVRDAGRDQVGDGQEQPGQPGLGAAVQRGEVQGPVRAWISRAGPPRSASGRRLSLGRPSAVITSAIPVRFSGVPSAASAWAISSMECPAVRSSMIRGRAASLAGAVLEFTENEADGRLKIFLLPPYSPDLNPDEWVWNNVKNDRVGRGVIMSKDDLKAKAISALRRLQKLPYIVRGFFRDPHLAYILD